MLFVVLMACACELANGANFSLVPHCNAFNNGFMTAIVGAFGNVGGILMALMFRFFPTQAFSQAWWVAGVFCMAVNALLGFLPVPKY
jgi:NNP family nitrate/nitrite transporter-like MFS transporter